MQVVNNKALLLNLRHPNKVTSVVPNSKAVGANEVLVKWGVEETLTLKSLNIDVPSPIKGQYQWPGTYKPFEHQKTTAEFLTKHRKAFCFNEQGTGKTVRWMSPTGQRTSDRR